MGTDRASSRRLLWGLVCLSASCPAIPTEKIDVVRITSCSLLVNPSRLMICAGGIKSRAKALNWYRGCPSERALDSSHHSTEVLVGWPRSTSMVETPEGRLLLQGRLDGHHFLIVLPDIMMSGASSRVVCKSLTIASRAPNVCAGWFARLSRYVLPLRSRSPAAARTRLERARPLHLDRWSLPSARQVGLRQPLRLFRPRLRRVLSPRQRRRLRRIATGSPTLTCASHAFRQT